MITTEGFAVIRSVKLRDGTTTAPRRWSGPWSDVETARDLAGSLSAQPIYSNYAFSVERWDWDIDPASPWLPRPAMDERARQILIRRGV